MKEIGLCNPACGIGTSGLKNLGTVYYNLGEAELYEEALRRGEGRLTDKGAFVAITGQHTGRSPKDKFVVRDASTADKVWWDNNKPMDGEDFDRLLQDFIAHAEGMDLFVQDLVGGADDAVCGSASGVSIGFAMCVSAKFLLTEKSMCHGKLVL